MAFNMVYAIYIFVCLIWDSTWMAIKLGLDDSPPLWSAGIRFLLAGLLIVLINHARHASSALNFKEMAGVTVPGIFMSEKLKTLGALGAAIILAGLLVIRE